MAQEGLQASLLKDLKTLSQEAKRPDSIAGQITGWISGPEHPAVRDAAEKVVQGLSEDNWTDGPPDYEAVLKPFLLACDTKSPRLASLSLVSLQKLLSRHQLQGNGILLVIRALEQVERMNDEGVKLKILQTALTVMQSAELAQNEEGVAAVLGVCFRILADTKNSDSVLSTAMATVRQAVALVFEHVGSANGGLNGQPPAPDQTFSSGAEHHGDFQRAGSSLLAQQGAANAALKLLDDLCMMMTANEAMLKWLKAPSLPRVFVLDLLDFVLSNTAPVFRNIAAFEHALLVRVCQLLTTMLQNLLDPSCERPLQESDLRVVLRVVRTVIWQFHTQLRSKCGVFVDALLAGVRPDRSLWQRMNVMVVIRQLSGNARIVHFLFTTYDLKQDSKLNAVTSMIETMAGIVEAFVLVAPEVVNLEAMQAVSGLYQQRSTAGKEWLLDTESAALGPEMGAAYLCMLAVDSLLGFVSAVEVLTDARTSEKGHISENAPPEPVTCAALVEASWRTVLPVLSCLLAAVTSEALMLQLLKAYSSFTQACGELEMVEPRDAFLSSLCDFTLSLPEGAGSEGAASAADNSGRQDASRRSSAAGGVSSPVEEAFVLTPKNVQSLRTLFNIAHRLDHHLGRSWFMVLDNLNTLDKMLHSPRTTTQEVSSSSSQSSNTLSSDLAILSTAANQLFESTSAMSTKACTNMLLALREVSNKSLVSSTQQAPGSPRLFALGRMVEVLLFNLHRLHDLWPIFLEHIVEVLGESRPSIRAAALDALSKAVGGALASVVTSRASHRSRPPSPEEQVREEDAATKAGAAEHMLLAALVALYGDAVENDVCLGLLRITLQALQRHGEQLSSGWEIVLRLLDIVPAGNEASTISLAFQGVQLVAADFMSNLPAQLLKSTLKVAALYAAQQADMNVSLTAINLLWNTADLLARRSVHGGNATGEPASSTPVPNGSSAEDLLDHQQFEELLRILFRAIQGMSLDTRPEVRNCAVRTLFLVVVSQGSRLSNAAWEEVLWQLLFPLLGSVHHMAATSSREESQVEILGKVKGKSVPMVMHHSRNSQQKAWDETLVLALAGMGRLLRGHLPTLVDMPAFPQGWEELMLVLESSMAGGRREVALAAMAVLVTVMQAHGGSELLARPMWKRALRATGVGVEAAASPQCMVPLQARLELVFSVGQLHAALKTVLEAEDLHDMFGWLESLVKNPFSEDDTAPVMPGTMPAVQKAALQVFPSLAPLLHESLWGDFLGCLLRLLRPSQLMPQPTVEQVWEPGSKPSARDLKRWATSSLLMEAVLTLLVELFRDQVPWQQRATNMAALVTGVGECMATRFSAFGENLWRAAVSAFNAIVAIGLPAVNIAYVNDDHPPGPAVWIALAQAFEWLLLGTELTGSGGAAGPLSEQEAVEAGSSVDQVAARTLEAEPGSEQDRSDADLEASVLDTLTDTVLTACTWCPEDVRKHLVGVVDRGIARPSARNLPGSAVGARFPQLCLRKLYVICSRGGYSEVPEGCLHEVAQAALPLLLLRAERMLTSHAATALAGVSDSQEEARMDDFLCMLEVLQALSVLPTVTDAALPATGPLKDIVELRRSTTEHMASTRERLHLLVLYPMLAACITSRELRVRELVQDILLHAGESLGLVEMQTDHERPA